MSSQSIREDLLARFASVPGADDAFIDQCVNICITYNLSGESLYYKWESLHFSASSRSVIAVTAGTLDTLRAQLKRELTNAQLKAAETAKVKSKLDGVLGMGSGTGLLGSRFKAKAHVGLVNARPEGTGVTDAFMSAGGQETARTRRVVFEGPTVDEASKKRREFRYMYEKISERSEVLDDRLDEIGELVREHYGIPELSDPSASTDHDVVVVGRITLDSDASSTVKLNESSLCLESSRMMGSGSRIPLKFDTNVVMRGGPKGQSSIGMFPGAIVAFKGRNGGVGWFSVSEILTLPPLVPKLPSTQYPTEDCSFSMVIASGPYTVEVDMQFTPWRSLVQHVKSSKPDVLLLFGPFVDSGHPSMRSGQVDKAAIDIFHTHFTTQLREFLDASPDSLVLLVPSIRDSISTQLVFPQAELNTELSFDSRVKLLPNPCSFQLNEVSFAATSVDVLFHLRKEEILKRVEEVDPTPMDPNGTETDAMANLCRHILQQRSFYPIFPTPWDFSHEVNLDVSHMNDLQLCSKDDAMHAPHILLMPSRLKQFFKMVDHTMAINPSFVNKYSFVNLFFNGQRGVESLQSTFTVDIQKLSKPK